MLVGNLLLVRTMNAPNKIPRWFGLLFVWAISIHQIYASQPNIILILADDVGIEMTNAYGSEGLLVGEVVHPYKTPHIDQLAKDGLRFTNAFSTAFCAPSRAQLLTGRYPFRNGVGYPTLRAGLLSEKEISLATVLKNTGYSTGIAGKWNLSFGDALDGEKGAKQKEEQTKHIRVHGFEESNTFVGHTIQYGDTENENDYLPYTLNRWTCEFIERKARDTRPFYLQYSMGLIHTPIDGVPGKDSTGKLKFLDMVAYMDSMVGEILDTLDRCGAANDTVVIFAGDNGTEGNVRIEGNRHEIVSKFQGRLVKGGKRTLKDTGSRVPFLVRWPGVVDAGSSYDGLMDFSDIFPTLIELGGGEIPSDRVIDGRSFYPQLRGVPGQTREFVYSLWDASESLDRPHHFIRDARYKWVIRDDKRIPIGLYDCIDSPFEESFIEEGKETEGEARALARLKTHYEGMIP